MNKISVHHSYLMNKAKDCGLDLESLRKKYNLLFVIKLFKKIQKGTENGLEEIDPIFPENYLNPKISNWSYTKDLENAGFKLRKWTEPFVDEDNGEIVNIKRFTIKPLK